MRKSIKSKAAAKTKKAPKKAAGKKAKSPAKKVASPKKIAAKGGKKLSISELFELKKKKQAQAQNPEHSDQSIPPHELDDKVSLQKAQTITKLRSGAGGNRHH